MNRGNNYLTGKELTAERELLAKELPADVVAEYEQLRDQNQGIGAVELTAQGLSGAGPPIAPLNWLRSKHTGQ